MHVTVDRAKCQGHARCFAICPEVFELDDVGYAIANHVSVPPALEEAARRAVDACPEYAIEAEE
jgi:ferredoxin